MARRTPRSGPAPPPVAPSQTYGFVLIPVFVTGDILTARDVRLRARRVGQLVNDARGSRKGHRMRAMITPQFGPPDLFEERDAKRPQPGPGEVLVRVVA